MEKQDTLQLPKYSILAVDRLLNNAGKDEPVALAICDICGTELLAKAFHVLNNETQKSFVAGCVCVKKFTGKSAGAIMQENADYQQAQENLHALRLIEQKYYQLNKKWIDYLLTLAESNDFWNSIKENYEKYGTLTSNILNLLKCQYIKDKNKGLNLEVKNRIEIRNAWIATIKEDTILSYNYRADYEIVYKLRLVYKSTIFKVKIYQSSKLFPEIAEMYENKDIIRKISLKGTVKYISKFGDIELTRISKI